MIGNLRVAAIQYACGPDPEENRRRAREGILKAHARGARLALLPELFQTRYFCQTESEAAFNLAEPVPGETVEHFADLAQELEMVLVVPLFERRAPGIYHNTAVVLDLDGGIAGRYRKMHIPDDPGYYEKYYFTPGDQGFQPIDTGLGRLGVLICWDQWFPEAARLMTLAGARILLYPTAIGWDSSDPQPEQARQFDAWRTVQRGHAIANTLPVLCCNRWGEEPAPDGAGGGQRFWGGSFICGAQGEILEEAPTDRDAVLVRDLDLARGETLRRTWPFLRDRRIDAYGDLIRRWRDQ